MRALIIKMTSMGDLLHTLPAVTDAREQIEGIRFDWVVEEAFREIPLWHSGVDRSIAVSLRKWRRTPRHWLGREFRNALRELRAEKYDHIIDAQGLYKSAAIACLARGRTSGYDAGSAREPLAARFYARRTPVPNDLHAIDRTRVLFAHTLGYEAQKTAPDYGLSKADFRHNRSVTHPYLVFNHASTWPTKSWPETYWRELIGRATETDFRVLLPWGNEIEHEQARSLARGYSRAEVLPAMSLGRLAGAVAQATAAVSVDTGLGHLAAALGTPAVSIYGATDPSLTGTVGENQHRLQATFGCSPCFSRRCIYTGSADVSPACYSTVSPDQVWGTLRRCIKGEQT